MKKSLRSYIHVYIQIGTLAYLSLTGSFLGHPFLMFLGVIGVVLGVWAVWIMQRSVLSVYPDPSEGIRLVKKGPYKVIRHPMYAALFLVFIPLVLAEVTLFRLSVLTLFIVNQLFKLFYEEQLLKTKASGYVQYMQSTWRIIPYVF